MSKKCSFNVRGMLSILSASSALGLLMLTPSLAQTTTYDGSTVNPNPAPGTTIDNGSGDSAFFRGAAPPSNTTGNAGDATIDNHDAGVTHFLDDSTANEATINNSSDGVTFFETRSRRTASASESNRRGAPAQQRSAQSPSGSAGPQ